HVFLFDLEHRGYFWIFPFLRDGERWANVGYGNATDSRLLKERFREYCRSPEAARHLAAARFEGRPVGFPLNLARLTWAGRPRRAFWGPGYFLLGDAAALIHPLSGEGISFAIESGRLAAEVLLDSRIRSGRRAVSTSSACSSASGPPSSPSGLTAPSGCRWFCRPRSAA